MSAAACASRPRSPSPSPAKAVIPRMSSGVITRRTLLRPRVCHACREVVVGGGDRHAEVAQPSVLEPVDPGRAPRAPARAPRRPARPSSRRRSRPARRRSARRAARAAARRRERASSAACFSRRPRRGAASCRSARAASVERRPHAAAAVVAAHDDVLHLQHIDRELEHREAVEVGVHDDVGDVPVDEQLAGRSPTIWFAGTRLSEQPIQRYSGACASRARSKKPGSRATMSAAQARLFSNSSTRSATAERLSG